MYTYNEKRMKINEDLVFEKTKRHLLFMRWNVKGITKAF